MQEGKKYYNYYSTMRSYVDFVDFLEKSKVEQHNIDILMSIWSAYHCNELLESAYFQLLRVSDGKYTLTLQKYVDESYSIKVVIDNNYANACERFV